MKSLIRMYSDQGKDVIFYENAASPQRKKHAAITAVPLSRELGETAPAYFKVCGYNFPPSAETKLLNSNFQLLIFLIGVTV